MRGNNFNRPATLPGSLEHGGIGGGRPGFNERPGFGNLNHPSTLPANIARPGIGNHPNIGGGNNFVNHPSIGGGNNIGNRVNIGNTVNVGGHNNFVGNHPAWAGSGYYRPWVGAWEAAETGPTIGTIMLINPHYGWYNGPWDWLLGEQLVPAAGVGRGRLGLGLADQRLGIRQFVLQSVLFQLRVCSRLRITTRSRWSSTTICPAIRMPWAVWRKPNRRLPRPILGWGCSTRDSPNSKRAIIAGALANFDGALQQLPNDPVVHEVSAPKPFSLWWNYPRRRRRLDSLLSSAPAWTGRR